MSEIMQHLKGLNAESSNEEIRAALLNVRKEVVGSSDSELTKLRGQFVATLQAQGVDRAEERVDTFLKTFNKSGGSESRADVVAKILLNSAWNDQGNGERFVAVWKDRVRHDATRRVWLIWDGTRWRLDDNGQIYRCAKNVTRRLRHYAVDLVASTAGDEAQRFLRFAIASGGRKRMEDMLVMASTEEEVSLTVAELDVDPYLFNVENGTIDLRTGKLRPHRQADLLTKKAPVRFDPAATCLKWERFVRRCMGDDDSKVRYLQLTMGCSLVGLGGIKAFLIHYGSGDNGKTTYLNVKSKLLGEYAKAVNIKTLLAPSAYEGGGQHRDDLAQLPGARFVYAGEPPNKSKLDTSLIKQLTGGDPYTTRAIRGQTFTFSPVCKIAICTNDRPVVGEDTAAIWDRIRPVPWEVVIPKLERIPNYHLELIEELPGILNWALAGCLAWQQEGLVDPEAVTAARQDYQEIMDGFEEWVTSCCVSDPSAETSSRDLHAGYLGWCRAEKIPSPLNAVHFGRRLPLLAGVTQNPSKKIRRWRGIRFGAVTDGSGKIHFSESSREKNHV